MILFSFPSTDKVVIYMQTKRAPTTEKKIENYEHNKHANTYRYTAHGGCLTMLIMKIPIFRSVLEIMRWFSNLTPIWSMLTSCYYALRFVKPTVRIGCTILWTVCVCVLFIFNACQTNTAIFQPKLSKSGLCVENKKGIRKITTTSRNLDFISSKLIWEIELSSSFVWYAPLHMEQKKKQYFV